METVESVRPAETNWPNCPWCTTRVNSASFFSLPLPLSLPRRRCYSIFSEDFDIGWNKVKLSVGFFWKRRRDELGDSKIKSGINEMNFLLHYIFIKKRNRELTG